jgi:hypothetical protein
VLEGNPSPLSLTKRQALRFLVHFVGDIHQPLHVGTGYFDCSPAQHASLISDPAKASARCNDRGGNSLAFGAKELHAYWDVDLVTAVTGSTDESVLSSRLQQMATDQWKTPGDYHQWAEAWATESVHAAAAAYVPIKFGQEQAAGGRMSKILIQLPPSYGQNETKVVGERLGKAAVRLADLLNSIHWQP